MDPILQDSISESSLLLKQFNERDEVAFTHVYTMHRKELNIYASSLFGWTNMVSEDIVEDIFINLWMSKNRFENLDSIKAYLYVSIKNSFIKHYQHKKHVITHQNYVEKENDFVVDIIETKIYSLVDETLKLLPQAYAEVMSLYLDGWKTGEIAASIGRPEQSVYNMKHEAIKILRKKLSNDKLLIMILLLEKVDF